MFSFLFLPLCFFSNTHSVDCLMVNGWPRGRGWSIPLFIAYCCDPRDLMGGRIAAIFGYDLIFPLFALEENHHFFSFRPCQACHQTPTLGPGEGVGRCYPTCPHLVISPHLKQMIYSLFSINSSTSGPSGWSSSPYSSASFDKWCSPNGPSAHIV